MTAMENRVVEKLIAFLPHRKNFAHFMEISTPIPESRLWVLSYIIFIYGIFLPFFFGGGGVWRRMAQAFFVSQRAFLLQKRQ